MNKKYQNFSIEEIGGPYQYDNNGEMKNAGLTGLIIAGSMFLMTACFVGYQIYQDSEKNDPKTHKIELKTSDLEKKVQE